MSDTSINQYLINIIDSLKSLRHQTPNQRNHVVYRLALSDGKFNSPLTSTNAVHASLIDFAYLVNSSLQNNERPLKRLKVNCSNTLMRVITARHVSDQVFALSLRKS